MLVNSSSYNNMQLKVTGFFYVWAEQLLRKYLYTQIINIIYVYLKSM